MPLLLSIDHVQLAMPPNEEEAARRFYAGFLGLEEVPKPAPLASRGGLWFETSNVKIHLGLEPSFQPSAKAHVAFLARDLERLRGEAQARGYDVKTGEVVDGVARIYVYDPFGNRFEFINAAAVPAPKAGPHFEKTYPVLPLVDRALILAVALTQFFIGHGNVWRKPFDWDRSILFSYLTIAGLVLVDLLLRRRLKLVSWFLHSLEIVGIKFGLTAGFLLLFLIASHPKPVSVSAEMPAPTEEPKVPVSAPDARPPSILPPGSLGEISGAVVNLAGKPVEGALVFVSAGLEGLVFEAPRRPVTLENDGTRFIPSLAVVQTGQPLVLRSANQELHTLLMMKRDRSWVFNVPMLGSGQERTVFLKEPKGLVHVQCTVHGKREAEAQLAILNHPFFATTGPDGSFKLSGVPSGTLTLSAVKNGEGEATSTLRLEGQARVSTRLSLPGPAR
jgi:catechol 2,3-dioxygenase-like lactoylglutathione lyase family enzyme